MSDFLAETPFRVVRKSKFIIEAQTVAASMVLDRTKCPPTSALVEVRLIGTGGLTGTVTVTGELDGSPQSEVLTVTGPIAGDQWRGETCKRFDCVTGITTTGLADESPVPTLSAIFIGVGGNPIPITCEISPCVMGYLEHPGRQAWPMTTAGNNGVSRPWIAHEDWYNYKPRRGDLYVEQAGDPLVDVATYEIEGNPKLKGPFATAHWELSCREFSAADVTEIPAP